MTNFQKCNNIAKEFLLTQISGWKEMNDVYISYLVFREYFDDQIWNNSGKDFSLGHAGIVLYIIHTMMQCLAVGFYHGLITLVA